MKMIVITAKKSFSHDAYYHNCISDGEYETITETWGLTEGYGFPVILLCEDEKHITVFDPEERAVLFGIPKDKVTVRDA